MKTIRFITALALLLFVLSAADLLAQAKPAPPVRTYPPYVALKVVSRHPSPDGTLVTMTLDSGAFIRVRAIDIDYDRTAAYTNRVILKPTSVVTALDGKSQTLEFSRGWIAPVWVIDLDADVVASGFAAYHGKVAAEQAARHTPSSNESLIRAKCEKDWPDDFVMRNYCEERQRDALAKIQ